MKKTGWLAVLMMLSFVGCRTSRPEDGKYVAGVAQELAEWRKQTIRDVKYDLFFSIPEEKAERVDGKVRVSFRLDKPEEVLLDFRADSCDLQEVSVNGECSEYIFRNEHIVIPVAGLKAGENEVYLRFTAGDRSLNRNDEFLYTLLVPDRARTVFPCFDQPDLKAEYTLSLEIPETWKAVSNTCQLKEEILADGRKKVDFAPTEPLSTYLFSFVAGKLERQEYTEGKRTIAAYYRETDPRKVAQLGEIFRQVTASLAWLEDFTGIPYPFAKYDIVILPGFQYGGMEHTGATLYNNNQMFLNEHATQDEQLRRVQLIAHETAHMWFGDYVTMKWFDDVWTKEVFANYFAACISEPMFPEVNHELNWLRTYVSASLSEDRTYGTTSIKQPLDNLNNAGLIYGQIIYNKAPVMMKKLVELMGEDNFRTGIREYLKTYAYGNATWEELVEILDRHTDEDLKTFSRVWVHEKGLPRLCFYPSGKRLQIVQRDPYNRGLVWPQSFRIRVQGERDTLVKVEVTDSVTHLDFPFEIGEVLPNVYGEGYGAFVPDMSSLAWILGHWTEEREDVVRYALLMSLHENYLLKGISDADWLAFLFRGIEVEKNPLTLSTLVSYLSTPLQSLEGIQREVAERKLYNLSQSHRLASCRLQLLRMLTANHRSKDVSAQLYALWESGKEKLLSENDYTKLAWELSIRWPEKAAEILAGQRSRITDPDRLRKFDFVSRAVSGDTLQQDALFASLLQAENRVVEPWCIETLGYLNHFLREKHAVKYIRPALEMLQEVQKTGDIFFPRNWVGALLRQHHSREAYEEVRAFLQAHPDYPVLLKNKILQASYPLMREFAAGSR